MIVTKIRVRPNSLFTMIAHAHLFANPRLPKNEWGEVLGLLGGKTRGSLVTVEKAYPVSHGSISSASMSDEAYRIFEIISEEMESRGWWIIGWYHSHPGHGLFLSSIDQRTQRDFQLMNPKAVALVIEPSCLLSPQEYLGGYQVQLGQRKIQGVKSVPVTIQRPKVEDVLQFLTSSTFSIHENPMNFKE